MSSSENQTSMTDKDFEILWRRLVSKKHGKPPVALTKAERLFYAANWLRGSVPRSGFIGYFDNSTGDDIRDAHEALALMGLDKSLVLLQKAQALILGDTPLPAAAGRVSVFADDLSEEEHGKSSDKLDLAIQPIEESFYECDDIIFQALSRFADQHKLMGQNS
jgi:hypothetical protein